MILIQGRGEKGRIQVPLDGTYPTGTVMPPLGERFFDVPSAAMTELREFGPPGGNLDQGAARDRNGTLRAQKNESAFWDRISNAGQEPAPSVTEAIKRHKHGARVRTNSAF
jgi:hypothetical protein